MVTITESAQDYLAELLSNQEDALGVRVFINQPGTPRAETCIAYCREGDSVEADDVVKYEKFTAWFEARSLPFLQVSPVSELIAEASHPAISRRARGPSHTTARG